MPHTNNQSYTYKYEEFFEENLVCVKYFDIDKLLEKYNLNQYKLNNFIFCFFN